MNLAAKRKSLTPAGLTALRVLLLLVAALFLPETRVWGFAAASQPASGQIAFASASAVGEVPPAIAYDASGSLVAAETTAVRLGPYGTLTDELEGTGLQANHLNQNAAFKSVIPPDEGLANGMQGNAFTDIGSPHYDFHQSLESFWNQYRRGGDLFGTVPTNAEYGQAVQQALGASGYTPAQAADIASQAAAQRAGYGLSETAPVPRIPGRINQKQP